ncbi:DUF6328 family protein [Allobranchiibius sp. CTAmp26]|uniref:DUF6328 family protein n=1 Tax=Allobranchiibius sp. CTAmp26 TaxID=2815214 RepID=UPI001AA17EE2|nr:DUF6328 family protein [Allobranchiibius sp. CTAmp26]MBO1754803.1 sodium:proton antiporter [Allobranchiibius sp. CTAmp26]
MTDHVSPDRGETPTERMDRNWEELLQELRVTQTGVQILAGFLLTLPFQQRFGELDRLERGEYAAAVVCAVSATILLIAPVSSHRLLFRRHEKDVLVTLASRLAKAGLAALAATIVLVVLLVFSLLVGQAAGLVAAAVAVLSFVGLWVMLPLSASRSARRRTLADRSPDG